MAREQIEQTLSGGVDEQTNLLSTRDVEDCFRDLSTGEPLLSRTAVSEITDQLWEDYRAF
jgi:hypothetical protein